jgi:hypothetical protein
MLPVASVLSAPTKEITSVTSVIQKSEFNIVLDENEKVMWIG